MVNNLLVCDNNVMLLQEVDDAFDKLRRGLFCDHVIALRMTEAKQVSQGHRDGCLA